MIKKIKNLYNRIVEYLFNEAWIVRLWDSKQNCYVYQFHFLYVDKRKRKYEYVHVFFNLNLILHTIISFIIFYILYKYDIQIIPEEYIEYCWIIIYIFLFYMLIFWIIIQMIFGIYYIITENYIHTIEMGLQKIVYLLTVITNVFIICYILKIDLNSFLQYNILFVIDCIIILIVNIYCKLFSYNIMLRRLVNFVYYPWIYIIICMILLVCTKKVKYYAAYLVSEMLCFINTECIPEKE